MTELKEREWTDQFGTHWECSLRDGAGRLHSVTQTRSPVTLGWPNREEARAAVIRAAIAKTKDRL